MKLIKILLIVVASTFLFAGPALAYLDATTISFVVQAIIAAIFGVYYFVKLNWYKLKTFFKGKGLEAEVPPEKKQVKK